MMIRYRLKGKSLKGEESGWDGLGSIVDAVILFRRSDVTLSLDLEGNAYQ